MYRMCNENGIIGIMSRPRYIKALDNGCLGFCCEAEACGVALGGVAYHLDGRPTIEGKETVAIDTVVDDVVSEEYTTALADRADLLAIVGAAVETQYNADLEVIDNV